MTNSFGHKGDSGFQAKYSDQPISDYMHNPLIEALPPIWTEEEVIDMLRTFIPYDSNERLLPPEIRGHCVEKLFHCFEPLEKHLDVEQKLSRVIRQGYIGRNPLSAEYVRKLHDNYRMINNGSYELPANDEVGTSALGFTVIGFSGVGKSKGIEKILSLYPQLIVHSNYKREELNLKQIPWLKIDCPFDGGLRGLCFSFFSEIDRILGSNHLARVNRGSPVINTLLGQMAQIAYLHCLGVLIVDEIQHLSLAKSGGSDKMLNFFVTLVNTMRVPVVLIGTGKALSVLQGQFRQARRGTGQGDVNWERMQPDQWELFIKNIWKYQWTDEHCPLTEEINKTLYEESQGIIDVAIKIYAIAQWELIAAGQGRITSKLLKSICEDKLTLIKPMLEALKSGDTKKLAKYDDIAPLEFEAIRKRYQKQLRLEADKQAGNDSDQIKLLFEHVVSRLINVGIDSISAKETAKTAIENRTSGQTIEQITAVALNLALSIDQKPKKRAAKKPVGGKRGKEQGETRTAAKREGKSETSIVDDLKDNGKIKSPLDKLF